MKKLILSVFHVHLWVGYYTFLCAQCRNGRSNTACVHTQTNTSSLFYKYTCNKPVCRMDWIIKNLINHKHRMNDAVFPLRNMTYVKVYWQFILQNKTYNNDCLTGNLFFTFFQPRLKLNSHITMVNYFNLRW